MDSPVDCLACGQPMERRFEPSSNIFVPIAFKSGLSWSDFHDVSEKELAKNPNIEPYNRVASRPGVGSKTTPDREATRREMAEAVAEAKVIAERTA